MARKANTRTGISSSLGPLETQIMRTLWAADEPLTVTEVRRAMRGKPLAYTTVMTSLNRIAAKGLVARRRTAAHWGYTYQAKLTPQQLAADIAKRIIRDIAPGPIEPVACLLLGLDPQTCAAKLAAMRKRPRRSTKR